MIIISLVLFTFPLGVYDTKQAEKTYFKDKLVKLNEDIFKFAQVLPAYQFLTAFSQLVSRICHSNFSVWKILKGKFNFFRKESCWKNFIYQLFDYPKTNPWPLTRKHYHSSDVKQSVVSIPRSEVGFQSMAERITWIRTRNLVLWMTCYPTVLSSLSNLLTLFM